MPASASAGMNTLPLPSAATADYLPIIHLVFANLKTWLIGIHHGVAISIFKPISMSSRSALTGASTHRAFRSILGSWRCQRTDLR